MGEEKEREKMTGKRRESVYLIKMVDKRRIW